MKMHYRWTAKKENEADLHGGERTVTQVKDVFGELMKDGYTEFRVWKEFIHTSSYNVLYDIRHHIPKQS
jgi:hypothetical protein